MAFGDYVRVLRTYWRSILAVTVLGILLGGGATLAVTPMYTASAQVLFTANAGDGGGQDLAFGQTYVQGRMINYRDLARQEYVLGPVVSLPELGLTQTPKQLSEHVSAEFVPTSTILVIDVEDESKRKSAQIATAVAQSLIAQVAAAELQAPVIDGKASEPRSLVTGQLVSTPSAPDSPSSPNLQLYLVAGAMFGLILGLAIALMRFVRRDRGVKTIPAPAPPKPPAPAPAPAPKPPVPGVLPPPPPVAPTFVPQTPLQPAEKPQNPKRSGRRTRR